MLDLTRMTNIPSPLFRIFRHGTMGLKHLSPANNMIKLKLSANLSVVKGLIQLVSPLNDCFIAETQD